jgi:hypothetical protein
MAWPNNECIINVILPQISLVFPPYLLKSQIGDCLLLFCRFYQWISQIKCVTVLPLYSEKNENQLQVLLNLSDSYVSKKSRRGWNRINRKKKCPFLLHFSSAIHTILCFSSSPPRSFGQHAIHIKASAIHWNQSELVKRIKKSHFSNVHITRSACTCSSVDICFVYIGHLFQCCQYHLRWRKIIFTSLLSLIHSNICLHTYNLCLNLS